MIAYYVQLDGALYQWFDLDRAIDLADCYGRRGVQAHVYDALGRFIYVS